MKWHHTIEVAKSLEYMKIKNYIVKAICTLVLTFMNKIELEYGKGV